MSDRILCNGSTKRKRAAALYEQRHTDSADDWMMTLLFVQKSLFETVIHLFIYAHMSKFLPTIMNKLGGVVLQTKA